MHKERFRVRRVGPLLVIGRRWGDAVLEHGGAAKEVFLKVMEAVAEEGEPAWRWGIWDAEREESITTENQKINIHLFVGEKFKG